MNNETVKDKPATILLVEDNVGHSKLIELGLKDDRMGHKVHRVPDGRTALDYLWGRGEYAQAGQNPRPGLILLDLRMPRIDGLEVLKEIKSSPTLRSIPVVILTTSESRLDMVQAYEFHANSYLVKPVGYDKLQQLLTDTANYWLNWNFSTPSVEGKKDRWRICGD